MDQTYSKKVLSPSKCCKAYFRNEADCKIGQSWDKKKYLHIMHVRFCHQLHGMERTSKRLCTSHWEQLSIKEHSCMKRIDWLKWKHTETWPWNRNIVCSYWDWLCKSNIGRISHERNCSTTKKYLATSTSSSQHILVSKLSAYSRWQSHYYYISHILLIFLYIHILKASNFITSFVF